jgi:hypothetical protein
MDLWVEVDELIPPIGTTYYFVGRVVGGPNRQHFGERKGRTRAEAEDRAEALLREIQTRTKPD